MIEPAQLLLARMLAYYRSPLQHPQKPGGSGPLPAGLTDVLEMLSESRQTSSRLYQAAEHMDVSKGELRQATYFYIKQVLFTDDADYYRILGISPGASAKAIRHHYRLLIGFFHPDKRPDGEVWDDFYATRINNAYNTLKRPDKRKRYDLKLRALSEAAIVTVGSTLHTARKPLAEAPLITRYSLWQRFLGSYIWLRHPKVVVVVGIGIVVALVLFIEALSVSDPVLHMAESQYVQDSGNDASNSLPVDEQKEAFMRAIAEERRITLPTQKMGEKEAIGPSAEDAWIPTPDSETDKASTTAVPEERPVEQVVLAPAMPGRHVKEVPQPAMPGRHVKEVPQPAMPGRHVKQVPQPAMPGRYVKQVSQPVMPAAKAESPVPPAIIGSTPRIVPLASAVQSRPDPGIVPADKTEFPLRKDLLVRSNALVMQYVDFYEAGNLLGILNLFSPQVVVKDGGGLVSVANRFDELFRDSRRREMRLQRYNSTQVGEREVVVDVQAVFMEMNGGSDAGKQTQAHIKFRLQESNKRLLISQYIQENKQGEQ